MVKVVLQFIAVFSNYNPILKFGFQKFMSTINDAVVHGQCPPTVYGKFISYKQNDMLHTVNYLKSALEQGGIRTFVDFTLDGGVQFWRAINEAIKRSEIAIVVASQNFHFSPRCLNKLVRILECKKKKKRVGSSCCPFSGALMRQSCEGRPDFSWRILA